MTAALDSLYGLVGSGVRRLHWARRALRGQNRHLFPYTAIMMVKNEADIIRRSVGHAVSLMDLVLVIDDGSTDGTRETLQEMAAAHPTLVVFDRALISTTDALGYMQAEALTWASHYAAQTFRPKWQFFLDADEFLPFATRADFRAAFAGLDRFGTVQMPWRNVYPVDPFAQSPNTERFAACVDPSVYPKIAFQPDFFPAGGWRVGTGAHKVRGVGFRDRYVPAGTGPDLIHIPCRSNAQALRKVELQISAAIGPAKESYHTMLDKIGKSPDALSAMRYMALSYQTDDMERRRDADAILSIATHPPAHLDIVGLTRPATSPDDIPHDIAVRGGLLEMSPDLTRFSPA